jgi:uncharacterized RDD family membrane protein YckC
MPPYATPGALGTPSYSSWGNRVVAYLVRGLILLPFYIPVLILAAINDALGLIAILAFLVFAVAFSVRGFIQRGHLGYDFGDRVSGQHLIKEATGAPVGSGMTVFLRMFVHFVDSIICYIGWLFPLWDAKRQTICDKIMGTVFVTGRPQTHDAKALITNAFMFWTPVIKS